MCTTNLSPTPRTGSPSADWSMPELSIATCPRGSHSTANTVAGGAAISRCTSNLSIVMPVIVTRGSGRQPAAHAGQQLVGVHRLRHVVGGAGVQALLPVTLHGLRCHGDDR